MKIVMLILAMVVSSMTWAVDAIGYVKTVKGDAFVDTESQQIKAEVGTPVHLGSVLRTGKNSSLGVTFNDETLMSLGSDTRLTVEEFLYKPAQGKLKLTGKLAKGSLNYVSGVIAKLQPDAVTVKTPSGIIGVRGTQFLVKVDD